MARSDQGLSQRQAGAGRGWAPTVSTMGPAPISLWLNVDRGQGRDPVSGNGPTGGQTGSLLG